MRTRCQQQCEAAGECKCLLVCLPGDAQRGYSENAYGLMVPAGFVHNGDKSYLEARVIVSQAEVWKGNRVDQT